MLYSARDKIILRALSEDSRSSLAHMAKLAGCSYVTVGKIIEQLVEKLDLKFVLELDLTKLGFLQRHILMIKFSKKPPRTWLEQLFKEEKTVDVVYETSGQFDLVVFASENDPVKYVLWEFKVTQKLSTYGVQVKSSDLPYFSFGYIPVGSAFIDDVKIKMKKDDKLLLQILNENSRISFSELAKRMKLSESTIRYKVFNLVKIGIIKRFTVAVQKPPESYIICFFENWTSYTTKFEEKAALERKFTMNIDEKIPLLTKFQISIPLSGSFGNFTMALFDSDQDALINTIEKRREIYRNEGYEEIHARVLNPIKGLLPYRNLNVEKNYNVVKWE